jgi:hypothetical protein
MYKKLLLLLTVIFVFSGCLSTYYKIKDEPMQHNGTNFANLIDDLSSTPRSILRYNKMVKNLYILDFVNIDNLQNVSKLGFILSNELKATFSYKLPNSNLQELELSKNIKIGNNGSKVLTRDLKQLKNKNIPQNSQLLVGSYIITSKQLILYLKLIDLNTGNILSSTRVSTIITAEILQLEGIQTDQKPLVYQPLVL